MKTYTGVGSRKTPRDVCGLMTQIADWLRRQGYTLRSGAATGADTAFEAGAGVAKEIYLPWRRFNRHRSGLCMLSAAAIALAAEHHPAWDRCSPTTRRMHARNSYQVLGEDLHSPAEFVACWTGDGLASSGTGQAIRIAEAYAIPVFNLHDPSAAQRLFDFVTQRGVFA